jgi:hypothetical protein
VVLRVPSAAGRNESGELSDHTVPTASGMPVAVSTGTIHLSEPEAARRPSQPQTSRLGSVQPLPRGSSCGSKLGRPLEAPFGHGVHARVRRGRSFAVVPPGTSGQTTARKRAPMLRKWPIPGNLAGAAAPAAPTLDQESPAWPSAACGSSPGGAMAGATAPAVFFGFRL